VKADEAAMARSGLVSRVGLLALIEFGDLTLQFIEAALLRIDALLQQLHDSVVPIQALTHPASPGRGLIIRRAVPAPGVYIMVTQVY
jgi:hypothetical protein